MLVRIVATPPSLQADVRSCYRAGRGAWLPLRGRRGPTQDLATRHRIIGAFSQ